MVLFTNVILICFSLLACNSGSKNKLTYNETRANGHYWIETFTLQGDCPNPPAFELIIWNNTIYENQESATFDLTGQLLKNFEFEAVAILDDGVLIDINGALLDFENIHADWQLMDETCNGYMTGQRITL